MPQRLAKRVLLIGWDAADWKILSPMMDAGLMPTLNRLVERGVMGNIATLRPALSPMLWNSIATGKRADKHGILAFVEPDPRGQGVRPVRSTSRKCKAIWNILTQNQMKSNIVGWYATHPAEPIGGVIVSDQFGSSVVNTPSDTLPPLPEQAVHPRRLFEAIDPMRVHLKELHSNDLTPFMPLAGKIDQEKDRRLEKFARLLAECFSIHAAGTLLMETEPWDFTAIYYEAIDRVNHEFMQYHPPKMPGVSDEDFELYKDVVTGVYRYHDMMLERLLQLAGEDTTVILMSDHGFHSDHLRPTFDPGPVGWHRPYGMLCIAGPGIRKDERIYGASLLDIAPTVLTLLGLPIGKDMDGRPLLQAFETPPIPQQIDSWESVAGEAGLHGPDVREDPLAEQAALQQLIDLGYVEAPPPDAAKAARQASMEMKYNLAQVLIDLQRHEEAAGYLEEILAERGDERGVKLLLAQCYHAMGRREDCRSIIDGVLANQPDAPIASLLKGMIELGDGNSAASLPHLLNAERADPQLPTLHCRIGEAYLMQSRWPDAERAFRRALEIDGDSAPAHHGLAATLFEQGRYEDAVDEALRAVGLLHHFPRAHFTLGAALARTGRALHAIEAFKNVLRFTPHHVGAHRALARLYAATGDTLRASEHQWALNTSEGSPGEGNA